MKRNEALAKVKEHFKIEELVCPHVYQRDKNVAWRYFPTPMLETIATLRDIIGKPMVINTWINGGYFSQRGLRCNLCDLVSSKTRGGKLYVSAHMLAQGIDFSVPGMEAEEVRKVIKENSSKLPWPVRLEKGVSWVHVDIYSVSDKKVTEFEA